MDTPYDFLYSPPSGKLTRRLAQVAELGGYETSPIRIASIESTVVLLDARRHGLKTLEVCEDGRTVRFVRGQNDVSYRFTRAFCGGTASAAHFAAKAPLRAWLTDGFHASLVCLGPNPAGPTSAPSRPPPAPSGEGTAAAPSWAPDCGCPAQDDVTAAAPSSLEFFFSLERPSVLLECLQAAFSQLPDAYASTGGVALWCYELSSQGPSRDGGGSGSSNGTGSGCGGGRGRGHGGNGSAASATATASASVASSTSLHGAGAAGSYSSRGGGVVGDAAAPASGGGGDSSRPPAPGVYR